MRNLAPIGVSTYSRINHLKQTIEALQKNTLAKESDLYIFSDAAKPGDEEKIATVRNYIHTIDGFKTVNILERKTNSRVKNNRGGIKQLLDEYGRTIFMEDDIVTAPGFLQFMNDGLDFYRYDERITSISGFTIPFKILNNYKEDVFILTRYESWGSGFWNRSFKFFNYISENEYKKLTTNKKIIKEFIDSCGDEAYNLMHMEFQGKIDAGDIKFWFWQFLYNTYTLYPMVSLVRSIGLDGSGVHMGITDKWDLNELWDKKKFNFIENIRIDERIRQANYDFYRESRIKSEILFFKGNGLFLYIFTLVKRIIKKISIWWELYVC